MPRSSSPAAPSRAASGRVTPAPAPRKRDPLMSWMDISIEHLDLDQFGDDGNLRASRYRHRPPTIVVDRGEGGAR